MEYIKALELKDLPIGQKKIVTLKGMAILLVNDNGTVYAINNKCPHMGGSLGDGELRGTMITCPRHGSSYEIVTGKNVGAAKIGIIKVNVKDAQTYPVKVEGNDILVGFA